MNGEDVSEQDCTESKKTEKNKARAVPRLSIKRRRSGRGHGSETKSDAEAHAGSVQNGGIRKKDAAESNTRAHTTNVAPQSRGLQRLWHRREKSLGSSPLATKVLNARPESKDGPKDTKVSESLQSSDGNSGEPDNIHWDESAYPAARPRALGLDTDSAQLVNIALSLSESRKRNFSGGTFTHGRDVQHANTRVTSSGSRLSYPSYSPGAAHRQQNSSPQSRKTTPRRRVASSLSQQTDNTHAVPDLRDAAEDDGQPPLNASSATITRVERAKEAFELMYEYRRLLQHLPEARVVNTNTGQRQRHSKKASITSDRMVGREYNPLQYVRNRKLRLRERRPIDAEAEGWLDLDRVRAWVDAVKQDEEDDMALIHGVHRLPPFESVQAHDPALDIPLDANSRPRKPRPHNDWTFIPSELLADIEWRFQGDNLRSMEDSSGQKLFGSTMQPTSPRLSKDSVRELRSSASLSGFVSSTLASKDPRQSLDPDAGRSGLNVEWKHDDGGQGRKARWRRNFKRSREPSLSDDTDWEESLRAKPKHHTEREHMDNLALEKQMMDMLAHEETDVLTPSSPEPGTVNPDQNPSSLEASPRSNSLSPTTPPRPRPHRLKTDLPVAAKQFSPPRASLDDQVLKHRRQSSEEMGSTSPNSPLKSSFVPTIAINLSPPDSPRAKPASPERPTTSRFKSFTWSRSAPNPAPAVSDHDFAAQPSLPEAESRLTEAQMGEAEGGRHSLEKANGFLTPEKSKVKPSKAGTDAARPPKDMNENESKLRGFLKAGKVVDIVGSQVSRAGDALWKKDRSKRRPASPSSSLSSDDFGNDADVESSPYDLSRATTNNDPTGNLSQTSTRMDRPKYFMDNLPSFRSPADRDEPPPKSPKGSPDRDRITSQQKAQRLRGRPQRFDKFAPPRLGTETASPSPSPPDTRSQSRDYGVPRDSSGSRSSRMTSHHRLNDALGIPGEVGTVIQGPTPTGLSSLDPKPQYPTSRTPLTARPNQPDKRQWNISDRGMAPTTETITAKDINRVRALLLTSGVKAAEIARRAHQLPSFPSPLLQTVNALLTSDPLPPSPQASEHVTAARALLSLIENTHHNLQDNSTHFTDITVKDLQAEIATIDTRVNSSLTPLVRDQADEADIFSGELSSSHTLAVKTLSDRVDVILRRRRRRRRWMRRGVWVLVEWGVLTVMWMVWFVVVIVRVLRGLIWLPVGFVRWLFLL